MRYLRDKSNLYLVYGSSCSSSDIVGYTNYDYGRDLLRRRSLKCYVCTLFGCAISCKATLQSIVAFQQLELNISY